jgi:outer membrane protein assembly factor BamB
MSNTTQNKRGTRFSGGARWCALVAILAVGGWALFVVTRPEESVSGKPIVDIACALWATEAALFAWLMLFSRLRPILRVKIIIAWSVLAASLPLAVGVEGFLGDGRPVFTWRWTPTPDERFQRSLRQRSENAARPPAVDLTAATPGDFPAFRGRDRSGVVSGRRLAADWDAHPPKLLWRQLVGRGWSSFAAVGDFCVTQEQRGEFETVVCYQLKTGRQCWEHRDRALFHELMGGDGPRATPAIDGGRVYTLGATGILNCLDGATGRPIWSVDVLEDNDAPNRLFGMAGSPLVLESMVVVCPGGKGRSLVGYDRRTGARVLSGGDSPTSYSSPHPAVLAGRRQILSFNADGLAGHDAATGGVLWTYPWVTNPPEMNNVCQPVPLPAAGPGRADRVFVASGYGKGCAVLEVRESSDGLEVEPVWANRNLKAKFTSVVARDGFVYGLDEAILTCIDLESGQRRWKGGRYGFGQLLLVDDFLLIQADTGEIALVDASPAAYRERARFAALSSRTWNHPALAGRLLLVRNDREAACYELPAVE